MIGIGTFSGTTVSAFVVTAVTEGREGVVRLLGRIVQWRVGLAWYAFTFVGLPAIETLGTIARSRGPWRRSRRLICCPS